MIACTPADVLLVFALESEAQDRFNGFEKVFCGVGKVNATYQLTRALAKWQAQRGRSPRLVLNLGSCGSSVLKAGTIVNCTQFIQRDMDTTVLGTAPYATLADDVPVVLTHGARYESHPDALCGSGDNFVTDGTKRPWDVVDMEAYALAKVCLLEKVPFGCFKFVTDGADGQAATDWETALIDAARGLQQAVDLILDAGIG